MDTRRYLPRAKPKPKPVPSPWEPLAHVLDRLEEQDLLFFTPGGYDRPTREVLVDFLDWLVEDGIQLGKDRHGHIILRVPDMNG